MEFNGHLDLLIETGQIEKAEQLWDEKRIRLKAIGQMAKHGIEDYLSKPLHKQAHIAGYHIGYNAAVIKLSKLYLRLGNSALKKVRATLKNPALIKEVPNHERLEEWIKRQELAQKNTEAAWAKIPGLEKAQRISCIEGNIINGGINHNIKHYLNTKNFA